VTSITFAVDEEVKARMGRFSWVNWSDVARAHLIRQEKLENLKVQLASTEEKEFTQWSVALGKKAKKGRFKRLLSQLSAEEKVELSAAVKNDS
jgi:hypothetical protein